MRTACGNGANSIRQHTNIIASVLFPALLLDTIEQELESVQIHLRRVLKCTIMFISMLPHVHPEHVATSHPCAVTMDPIPVVLILTPVVLTALTEQPFKGIKVVAALGDVRKKHFTGTLCLHPVALHTRY